MVATFVSGWVVVALPDFAYSLGCVSFAFLSLCTSAGSMTPWCVLPLAQFKFAAQPDTISDA
jgi:hypothetical protein